MADQRVESITYTPSRPIVASPLNARRTSFPDGDGRAEVHAFGRGAVQYSVLAVDRPGGGDAREAARGAVTLVD